MGKRLALLALWGCALVAFAPAPALAQSVLGPQSYHLDPEAEFLRGCFPPCRCPVRIWQISGSYTLTYDRSDSLFDYYRVENVEWTVVMGGEEVRITGSGTYRIGGEFARLHQMALELTVGEEPPQIFDSGLVVGGAEFPRIDIGVSVNGFFCFDTVVYIRSSPDLEKEMAAVELAEIAEKTSLRSPRSLR